MCGVGFDVDCVSTLVGGSVAAATHEHAHDSSDDRDSFTNPFCAPCALVVLPAHSDVSSSVLYVADSDMSRSAIYRLQ